MGLVSNGFLLKALNTNKIGEYIEKKRVRIEHTSIKVLQIFFLLI